MQASPLGDRGFINLLKRLSSNEGYVRLVVLLAVSVSIGSCREVSGPGEPAVLTVLSIELSLPPGRAAFIESDTVTVYARVVDRNGVRYPDAEVEWEGPIVRTGAQTALATLNTGDNTIVARVRSRGQLAMPASISIPANPRAGEMLIWFANGSISRIPAPPGVKDISPNAMNNRGEIVGSLIYSEGSHRAFIWSSGSGFTELTSSFAGRGVHAADINDEGVVVGTVVTPSDARAFVWSREAGFTLIPDQSQSQSIALAINQRGIIAGARNGRPVLWSRDGGFTSYAGGGSPPPSYETLPMWSYAVAVNDNDEFLASWNGKYSQGVDWGWVEDGYPSVWTGTINTSLACPACLVSAMNNRREVVGVSWHHGLQAFKWVAATGVEILQAPLGQSTEAMAINDSGAVAGSLLTWNNGSVSRAAVWSGSKLTLIEPVPGLRSTNARDINNHGHVLVYAR